MVPSFIGHRCSSHRCVQRVPSDAEVVGTAQSIDGAKRALGSLLNVFNGTVALPAHFHLHLRDEIIVAGTDVGRMGGGGDRASPGPSDSTMRWLPTTHPTGATAHERWRDGRGNVLRGRGCRSATFGKSGSAEHCCNLALKHWCQN